MFEYHIINLKYGWNSPTITRQQMIDFHGESYTVYAESEAMRNGFFINDDLMVDYFKEKKEA